MKLILVILIMKKKNYQKNLKRRSDNLNNVQTMKSRGVI